jgi:hypothetical protein
MTGSGSYLFRRPVVETVWPQGAVRQSPLATTTFKLIIIISFFVDCLFAQRYDKFFLGDLQSDGFTFQVNYIRSYFELGGKFSDLEPLLWIHAIRTIVAETFVFAEELGGPFLATALICTLNIPLIKIFSEARFPYIYLLIPIVIAILSGRSALVALSIAYQLLFMIRRPRMFYLLISFFLANLSSGAVLNNLVMSLLITRNYRKGSLSLYVYIALLSISLYVSGTDKYEGFSFGSAGYNSAVYGLSGYWAVLSRSTIVVSIINQNYERAIAYMVLVALSLIVLFVSMKFKQYRGYSVVFVSALPSFLLEGLGVVSLIVPLLLFAAGLALPIHPAKASASRL